MFVDEHMVLLHARCLALEERCESDFHWRRTARCLPEGHMAVLSTYRHDTEWGLHQPKSLHIFLIIKISPCISDRVRIKTDEWRLKLWI